MIRIQNMQRTGRSIELRKIVIKLGSAVIGGEGGKIDMPVMERLADSVAALRQQGIQVIVVSSGAILTGRGQVPGFTPHTIPDRQALAAIGQVGLMHMYKSLFNARGFLAPQILLTREDLDSRRRYLNARYTMERLTELGAVPVVNENDTTTIDELQFGDNDELSALVAIKMNADLLVILSVVDGLIGASDEPAEGRKKTKGQPKGEVIPAVERMDEKTMALANSSHSAGGRGGMVTKLASVRMAALAGVHVVIANGKRSGVIEEVLTGGFRGTYFAPQTQRRMRGRSRWIAFGRKAQGCHLVIDEGACTALLKGKKSLLAAGVREVAGTFEKGAMVEVLAPDGRMVARGLVNYDSDQLSLIRGKKTSQIREILGDVAYEEVIHRDNMVTVEA